MHLAEIPGWIEMTLNQEAFDVDPPGGANPIARPPPRREQDILDRFDKNVAAGRAEIAATTDEQFMKPWSLLQKGPSHFHDAPRRRIAILCAQSHDSPPTPLVRLLRLNNLPVPAIYGPSADET